ncbi:MAG: HD domain-containing protein [Butyricicoccus sp.]|nr:HD domain-containing protein [Butyricicoccus sp.]
MKRMHEKVKMLAENSKRGTLNFIMVAVACALYVILIIATAMVAKQYRVMVEALDHYISCEKNASLVTDGSNYLTEQVQLYAMTLDPQYMENYFTEANVTRRRDTALEEISQHAHENADTHLEDALEASNALMETEIYAMRLVAQAGGLRDEALPAEVRSVVLEPADEALPDEDKIAKARVLVFGADYQIAKDTIMEDIAIFMDNAIQMAREKQQGSTMTLRAIMIVQETLLGILVVQSVITFILIFLRNRRKTKEHKTFINQIIHSFAKSIDIKDQYTNGHSFRVATYAGKIARKVGFSKAEAEDVYNIGLLHDIGKITVPDDILNKPGRLTDEEYVIMKQHASNGCEILQEISIAPELALGAGCHHERIDGKGYPDGRKGDEIPPAAQIIAVADAFDAMYSTRPYRKKMPIEDVIAELRRSEGTQLRAEYVEALIQLIQDNELDV